MTARILALLALLLLASPATVTADAKHMLPWCHGDQRASTRPPDLPPSLVSPQACRARASSMQRARVLPAPGSAAPAPAPQGFGYHHLGVTTVTKWSGILARLEVGDPAARAGTFDFLASRLMAKGDTPDGLAWLEAGWAETGWDGDGRQRVYTYDTNRDAWAFYQQYEIKPGDRIWMFVQTEQTGPAPAWQAWLWWGDAWHLLTSQQLPLTERATIEQYVEVHTETNFAVPRLHVDNVQLKDGPSGAMTYWTDHVTTAGGPPTTAYCLDWLKRFDTWAAGTCSP